MASGNTEIINTNIRLFNSSMDKNAKIGAANSLMDMFEDTNVSEEDKSIISPQIQLFMTIDDTKTADRATQMLLNISKGNAEAHLKAVEGDTRHSLGETYFNEIKALYERAKNGSKEKDGDIVTVGGIGLLFNGLLARMAVINNNKDQLSWNDSNYIYGLTIRMPKDKSGNISSCSSRDFAIPDGEWQKVEELYKRLKIDRKGTGSWVDNSKIDKMLKMVNCERGICKDNRWKPGFTNSAYKFTFCNGQESNPFYQALTATSVGGRKSRKQRKPRKSRRTRHKRRTRRSRK